MSVQKVELFHVNVPLRTRVKHASHDRTDSDNLVVRVTLDDGTVGHGEGVPRPYVTGETVDSTVRVLSGFNVPRHFGRVGSFEEAVKRSESLALPETEADPRGMAGNAARCALELAILDAYGRRFGRSLGDAIRAADFSGLERTAKATRVRYSGAITAASRRSERVSAWKMRLYGFAQIKLKVGVAGQDDPDRLREIRKIVGDRVDIRIDANESWGVGELVERVRPLLTSRPSVLEQPVRHQDVNALAELRPKIGMPVMLDESLCGYPDAVASVESGTADFLNVRLSKCGGVFPSLRIIALAKRNGLGVQLGCHPGETALLSAAGRHLAGNVRGLTYVEGSYDAHVLSENVTAEDLTFAYGGWAPALQGSGLGVRVDPERLERMTVTRTEVVYD